MKCPKCDGTGDKLCCSRGFVIHCCEVCDGKGEIHGASSKLDQYLAECDEVERLEALRILDELAKQNSQ